ncbi:MAG: redoxin [Pseudomonadales bacterium]|jgi:peroxiredoxin|nr:redoxin [Pseudomonadales bacterium]RLT88843.1 MAG: TlpA family protein disulfide reductase [Ketobacter sp. GenoA1]RLT97556.1 MAG: TlpA family protein disulfide reductase [Ketobacter sp.]HAG94922.1 TlpA family protein disulfide reductase [Gammaproteobacteria bacterium]MBI26591.1 redoxin [Pseudomonadales bacterium]|tara:strand:+ start:389 stop:898 length:510 start_codon:yes stop_codon:yes gene_type:complete
MQSMWRRVQYGVIGLALLASPAVFAKKPPVGDDAPDFTLHSDGPFNLRLSEQRGYIVAVVFWASWCRSCPVQLQALEQLQQKYRDFGVKVWAVTLDKKRSDAEHYREHKGLDLTMLFDDRFVVSERYDINDLPSSFIVDRDGVIRHLQDGFEPGDVNKFDTILQTLVSE